MRYLLFTITAVLCLHNAQAQITITASDMPVAGDTLRYSFTSPVGTAISPADSGANVIWNYTLAPIRQAVDTYQLAGSVNLLYAFLIGTTAAGYKVADSLPLGGFLPISIQQVYTFFEKKTSPRNRYIANAFAANISGIPTPILYTEPDVWYYFPLTYLNQDSSTFRLNITVPTLGSIKQAGYRKTRVDGWGTITTPYYTTPVNCIRVRSEIHQVDSIPLGTFKLGIPVNTVEYKWLVNGDHYPALWVTSNLMPGGAGETISSIKYRDIKRDSIIVNQVASVVNNVTELSAYPNPASTGFVTIDMPADWTNVSVDIFDIQSKNVAHFNDQRTINISQLPAGIYLGRVISGGNSGYFKFTK